MTIVEGMNKAERQQYLSRIRALEGTELAAEVLALIEDLDTWEKERSATRFHHGASRGRWNQDSWRYNGAPEERYEVFRDDPLSPDCRTSFCFAGWIGAIDGVKWVRGYVDMVATKCTCPTPDCVAQEWDGASAEHGQMTISVYAARRLGLDIGDAQELFNGENELGDLTALVDAMESGWPLDEVSVSRNGMGRGDSDPSFEYSDEDR